MILDLVYPNRNFYASNQVRSKLIYLLLDLNAICLYTQSVYYLFNALIDKTDIYI